MEEQENRIARIARMVQKGGLTEAEAKILYHLSEATELYARLPDHHDKSIQEWMSYQKPMVRMLMWRVVKRDHPEAWITIGEDEARDRAVEGEEGEPTL